MIHNEKCDNCLCRTVCHFTFPGYELTDQDGECGHYININDIKNKAMTKVFDEIDKCITFGTTDGVYVSLASIDKIKKELTGKE